MKLVIVTGASHGLGIYIAQAFHDTGWEVVGTGRSVKSSNLGDSIRYERFDASDAVSSRKFFNDIKNDLSKAEVCLVNNAGAYTSGSVSETSVEDYRNQMDSNYFSAVNMTKGLLDVVDKARVINVISKSALSAHANNSAYGSAKSAEMHFFQSLQVELGSDKYVITNLYPSYIASHGENDVPAIDPNDLSKFVLELAESKRSYYLSDIVLLPAKQ